MKATLRRLEDKEFEFKPVIFDLSRKTDQARVRRLIATYKIKRTADDYDEQLRELFGIKNPRKVYTPEFEKEFLEYYSSLESKRPLWQHGKWVFYPWLFTLVHVVGETDFQIVRTARNRNLISDAEQKKFHDVVVGIGGLSVGNSIALAIALQGGAKHMRLADNDRLALTNTNRIRAGIQNLGISKIVLTARQIYELNPYADVDIMPEGITPKNIKKFFTGPHPLDIVIDEMDNLAIKVLLREESRRRRIPLITAADNGDNGVLEVERYDLNPKTLFFHGRMGSVTYNKLKAANKFEIGRLITKWVGAETVTDRMKESLTEMGKTIVSWPQLGGAALLNGSAVAYCVRRIANGEPLLRDRALLSLDEKIIPGYNSPREQKKRERSGREFGKKFNI